MPFEITLQPSGNQFIVQEGTSILKGGHDSDIALPNGRTGFVHRAVMEDFPDLSKHQVYACGAPIVIKSAKRDFAEQCALPPQEFFADSFLDAGDRARARIGGQYWCQFPEARMRIGGTGL